MTSTQRWDRAALVPSRSDALPRAEITALPANRLPELGELFTFMRDAELRFSTLRLRIDERARTARGVHLATSELLLRHPGDARVTTTEEHRGTAGNYELWLSDGDTVRTYSGPHKLGTRRPVRNAVRGLDKDFPGSSRVYVPLTPLPMETLPETFVHPAGYCQNVLSTGRTWVVGTETVGTRPAVVVDCDHPRTIEMAADRPDFHIQIAFDRADGVILRLVETIGGAVTRHAEAVEYAPDAPIPASAFEFAFPDGTTMLY
jgi:outer membrane lipoprotein-sorting protein